MKGFYYFSLSLLGAAIVAAGFIFGGIGIVIGIVIALLIVLGVVIDNASYKKKAFCAKCKKKFDFESEVAYTAVSRKVKTFGFDGNKDPSQQMRSREQQKLRFECTCSACGNTQKFEDWCNARIIYYDGRVEDPDVDEEISR